MTVTHDAPVADRGLFARIFGVLLSPRDTYATVAARPRSLGVLAVVLVVIGLAQGLFLSTEIGQQLVLDQQIRAMEAFGINIPDEAYNRMEEGMKRAYITGPISQVVFWPIALAIEAGILVVIFSLLMGGAATFKHVYAIVAHSSVIVALQQIFSMALSYASEQLAGANLAIFVPMLDERNVVTLFLGSIDLFFVWATISLAIGLGVLYRRRTGPIASTMIGLYVVIALVIAFFRSGS
jgi:Yip1-like protein